MTMIQEHTHSHTNGSHVEERFLRKSNALFNLMCFTFLQWAFVSLGSPTAASSLISDSAFDTAFFTPNLRPTALRRRLPKFVMRASFLMAGSTFVYLFAAGSVIHGTTKCLTRPKAVFSEDARFDAGPASAGPQQPGGHA